METLPENCDGTAGKESQRLTDSLFGIITKGVALILRADTRGATIRILWPLVRKIVFGRIVGFTLAIGIGLGFMLAVGQSYGIGLRPAWKVYGFWWLLSPLFGFALIALIALVFATLEGIEARVKRLGSPLDKWATGILVATVVGGLVVMGGYFGAREDNPMLSSRPVSLESLSRSVADQSHVLLRFAKYSDINYCSGGLRPPVFRRL